jgi:hypothetical protein
MRGEEKMHFLPSGSNLTADSSAFMETPEKKEFSQSSSRVKSDLDLKVKQAQERQMKKDIHRAQRQCLVAKIKKWTVVNDACGNAMLGQNDEHAQL